jgi:carbamoyl-phosphate synthase large subunit
MTDATVLVTGCGAPGFAGTRWSLRKAYGDDVRVVGTDVRREHAGRYLCDEFYEVPPASDDDFAAELLAVCERADVDVVLPQVTRELEPLAARKEAFSDNGTTIAVPDAETIKRANDKYRLLEVCEALDVPYPETILVETEAELETACRELGYPSNPVVVKPPVSNGSRGMRILDANRDRKRAFYEEKPSGVYTTLEGLREVLGPQFPPLLVMEHLPGPEYTIDAFRPSSGTDETTAVTRRRDQVKAGISFRATVVNDDSLAEYTDVLANELDLTYAFGFQFKESAAGVPKILECNPRIQGTMVTSTLAGANLPAASVADALGDPIPPLDHDPACSFYRYWGGLGVIDHRVVGDIGGQG